MHRTGASRSVQKSQVLPESYLKAPFLEDTIVFVVHSMQDLLENRIKSFSARGKSPPPMQTNPLPPWWQTAQACQLSHPLDILRMAPLLHSTSEIEEVRLPSFRTFALYSPESSPPSLLVPNSLSLIISRTLLWVDRQCWNWRVGDKGVQKTRRKIFLALIFFNMVIFQLFHLQH